VEVSVLTAIPDLLSIAILYSLIPFTLYHPPAYVFISIIISCFIGFVQGVPWKKTLYNIGHIPHMISSSRYVHGMVMVTVKPLSSKAPTDKHGAAYACLLDNIISNEVTNSGPCYV
jgi:hypothetical protein